jgi:hypothetical protein
MRAFLLVLLTLAAIWDAFTTGYGTLQILGTTFLQIVVAILFSALVFAFNLATKRIMQWREGFVSWFAKFVWLVAIVFDFYTSWVAHSDLVISGDRTGAATFMLFGLTLLVTAAPMLLYAMWSPRSFRSTPPVEQVETTVYTERGA